ncbi:hypothetical protein HGP14_31915 [Rhizobium sp. P32RR-XVIII]|uniref:hypothetical protein n=1 Tax=Rhizobium sp. P32RR-XVIII TaxID=2726738 RepID=UPI001456363B|nr:hypothetical protein [Rhizobium sp. P32RR-XVIII]NLS07842.1 hypothetical protein [Rhizobium sp. P32RR-XVIII]
MTDEATEALLNFVRALARQQARIDHAAGVRFEALEAYTGNLSPENRAAVDKHMGIALELLIKPPNIRRRKPDGGG